MTYSRKLILAKYDFFDLAKINPLKVSPVVLCSATQLLPVLHLKLESRLYSEGLAAGRLASVDELTVARPVKEMRQSKK